jgi:ATP-dependent DNA helicase RecG
LIPQPGFFSLQRLALPFALTSSQSQAIQEIIADISLPHPMLRLLSADVGAGKTVVALIAAYAAAAAGNLALFMAPTEILARQHYGSAINLLRPLGMQIGLMLGSGQRQDMAGPEGPGWEEGRGGLIVGTSALLWRENWDNVGLVIIDEQHRFGVEQRLRLGKSGVGGNCDPHVLILSATPIPRTLHQALNGFMSMSSLSHHAPQRQAVTTFLLSRQERGQAFQALKASLKQGGQAYVVCPSLHPTDKGWDVLTVYQSLAKALPGIEIGLVHGQMKPAEQAGKIDGFQAGNIRLLVSTTVIEVGLDVAGATFMLVLSAEHFGLSQLHQLRGRVGRGKNPGQCWLVTGENVSENALNRLRVLCDNMDGLSIAEADLGQRGPGETLGYRQSGLPPFRLADWGEPEDMRRLSAVREIISGLNLSGPALLPLVQEARRRYPSI